MNHKMNFSLKENVWML